ncbi:hypothetical protein GGF31_002519 [Allomyces arbusculus]|nr:hypothetical protein GGF31_002519 [Allomyces arbusculus]
MNPRVFLDVGVNGTVGRIIIELFADKVPQTAENFRALCTGERGVGAVSGKPLHYKGSVFHRVIQEFCVQGGDFVSGNGTGGESIYGRAMEDEPAGLEMKHFPFCLSMANRGENTASSQFFITTGDTPHLDGKHVVFGRVVKGIEVVQQVEAVDVDDNDRPVQDVRIVHCGELEMVRRSDAKKSGKSSKSSKRSRRRSSTDSSSSASSASSSSSDSDSDRDDNKDRRRKRRSRRDRSSDRSSKKRSSKRRRHRSTSADRDAPPKPSVAKDVYDRLFGNRNGPRGWGRAGHLMVDPARVSARRTDPEGREIKGRGLTRYVRES